MRNFFKTIYLSVSSIDFYSEVTDKSFWKTLGFYVTFLFLITIIRSTSFIFWSLPQLQTDITQTILEFKNYYPQELLVEWDTEKLAASSNPQPIYYPTAFEKYFASEEKKDYFAILDTTITEASPSARSIFTITQTDILARTENNDISRLPIKDIIGDSSYKITQSSITALSESWEANKNIFLRIAQITLPFFLFVIFCMQRFGMILMESTLFFLFKKVQGKPWTFATAIKYTIHFFVAAEFIDMVANYVYPEAAVSLFSITVWVYFIVITFFSSRKKLL